MAYKWSSHIMPEHNPGAGELSHLSSYTAPRRGNFTCTAWTSTIEDLMKMTGILFKFFALSYCLCFGEGITANSESTGKKQYQIQNGPCSYTFLLPEPQNCGGPSSSYNQVQRDDMVDYDSSVQRLEQLENIMENNTQWLQKVHSSCTSMHSNKSRFCVQKQIGR